MPAAPPPTILGVAATTRGRRIVHPGTCRVPTCSYESATSKIEILVEGAPPSGGRRPVVTACVAVDEGGRPVSAPLDPAFKLEAKCETVSRTHEAARRFAAGPAAAGSRSPLLLLVTVDIASKSLKSSLHGFFAAKIAFSDDCAVDTRDFLFYVIPKLDKAEVEAEAADPGLYFSERMKGKVGKFAPAPSPSSSAGKSKRVRKPDTAKPRRGFSASRYPAGTLDLLHAFREAVRAASLSVSAPAPASSSSSTSAAVGDNLVLALSPPVSSVAAHRLELPNGSIGLVHAAPVSSVSYDPRLAGHVEVVLDRASLRRSTGVPSALVQWLVSSGGGGAAMRFSSPKRVPAELVESDTLAVLGDERTYGPVYELDRTLLPEREDMGPSSSSTSSRLSPANLGLHRTGCLAPPKDEGAVVVTVQNAPGSADALLFRFSFDITDKTIVASDGRRFVALVGLALGGGGVSWCLAASRPFEVISTKLKPSGAGAGAGAGAGGSMDVDGDGEGVRVQQL